MTEVLNPETAADRALEQAVAALERGEPVALPTETVYGLAADALSPVACSRIFEVKSRPLSDPLIVHLPDPSWLERVAEVDSVSMKLAEDFWPGPLTVVLPRKKCVPDLVTAGQDSVAVRMSAHPVFAGIIRMFGRPLAAPSANRFGRISPTSAADVVAELGGRIGLVVDGGSCEHGIESTILRITNGMIAILRRGPVTAGQLSASGILVSSKVSPSENDVVPGSMKSHYAPSTRLRIESRPQCRPGERVGLLAWRSRPAGGFAAVEVLSPTGDVREAAANLYGAMRRLDARNLDLIVAEPVPGDGLGEAIMERLQKAAA